MLTAATRFETLTHCMYQTSVYHTLLLVWRDAQCELHNPHMHGEIVYAEPPNAQAEALSSDSEEESEGAELRAAATAYKATAKRCVCMHVSKADVALVL